MTIKTAEKTHELIIWQWNANGFRGRRATFLQHIARAEKRPDIILVQETHCEHAPKIPGYRSYAFALPKTPEKGARVRGGICTFVKKGMVSLEHSLLHATNVEHLTIEVVIGAKTRARKEHVYIMNAYTKPKYAKQRYGTLISKIKRLAGDQTTLLCGDFNAPHTAWGYQYDTAKGRSLLAETQAAGYHLANDITVPTRQDMSTVRRDNNPDLTFSNNEKVRWRNTLETLGSDHCILEVTVPLKSRASPHRKQRITDWDKFRANLGTVPENIEDIEAWTAAVLQESKRATTEFETEEDAPDVDSRLAHLIEARNSLKRRWNGQRHNRTLRKRVAMLNREIEKHCETLNRQRWHAVCQEADGQIHKSRTWKLLRHLLDDTKTKSTQQHVLARTLLKARRELGDDEVRRRLDAKYLPATPPSPLPSYEGDVNPELDADIEEWEVRAVLQKINGKSAAGPDGVSNKELRNLSDGAIASLTRYYNNCWRSGVLPRKWKEARTVLIPKPGKPPDIENLRPISLTSCVGKVLEHVLLNRWQRYLEENELYPNTMLGFRAGLSTQDAMLLLRHEIIDRTTKRSGDTAAILGLDLLGAFDNVQHSAILRQMSRLNMGERSFQYVKDFLTERTATIVAGDLELPTKTLGSRGTPQGAVISPTLFNLVMIGVAERLGSLPRVRHTIYADDVTIWTTGGSDGEIEESLQQAVEAVEEQLQGTGLQCSPAKSELLLLRPPRSNKTDNDEPNINVRTSDGITIPKVDTLRVLGLHIESTRRNGYTIQQLQTKVHRAMGLIKKISTKYAGMRERNTLKLTQSFAVSHLAYVAAFHTWNAAERNKLNALIRKAHKVALGLYTHTNTERMLELGIHNTIEEIAEAQQTAQTARLEQTRTGRAILERLGHRPRLQEGRDRLPLPRGLLEKLQVPPLPQHMDPQENKERRLARARALTGTYSNDTGAVYVDVARYPGRRHAYVAAAVRATTGELVTAGSVRARSAEQAEELAIALALSIPECTTVLSDSRAAVTNFARNQVCASAVRACGAPDPMRAPITVRWFPAHMGAVGPEPNRNEDADRAAKALTGRPADPRPAVPRTTETGNDGIDDDDGEDVDGDDTEAEEPAPVTTYGGVLEWYRERRRRYPGPHPDLTRQEAVLLRQLQVRATWTPVWAVHASPELYETDVCAVCGAARATLAHMMWNCDVNPDSSEALPPHLARAVGERDLDSQRAAAQFALRAVQRQQARVVAPS